MDEYNRFDTKVADDVKEYVKMRIDSAKLKTVSNLSVISGGAIALLICLLFCMLALMIFSGPIVYGLSLLLNSTLLSALIIGTLYVIIGIMVFRKRTAFINMMVRVFSRMMFENHNKNEE